MIVLPPNGTRFSRAAAGGVGCKRMLGRRLQFIYIDLGLTSNSSWER